MYSLASSSYASALRPAAWGAPAVGSFGVGCGFSDSGESPLEEIGVDEKGRVLERERSRGTCRPVGRDNRRIGAVAEVRCCSRSD